MWVCFVLKEAFVATLIYVIANLEEHIFRFEEPHDAMCKRLKAEVKL